MESKSVEDQLHKTMLTLLSKKYSGFIKQVFVYKLLYTFQKLTIIFKMFPDVQRKTVIDKIKSDKKKNKSKNIRKRIGIADKEELKTFNSKVDSKQP